MDMATSSGYSNRQTSQSEQLIYNYFLRLVEQESPEILIDRFRCLFIEGSAPTSTDMGRALEDIVRGRDIDEDFTYILNRCCHILVNRWQMNSRSKAAVPELVALFDRLPSHGAGLQRSRAATRLNQLNRRFTESEQYSTLKRLAQIITEANAAREAQPLILQDNRELGTLIPRYPYLYEHCLSGDDSTLEQQQTIRTLQAEQQRQYDLSLSQYVTYQVRCTRAVQQGMTLEAIRQKLQPVSNPTLLTNPELAMAVRHFAGKVEQGQTYRDLANNFSSKLTYGPTFGEFKRDLYGYIQGSVSPDYGRRRFNSQLCSQLHHIFPNDENQKVSDFLVVRTCSQLLNFLVVESPSKVDHVTFIDLISNLGPTVTTGILLKLILLCKKVKPYLEKRLSILFNHYEKETNESVLWLIQMLENLNVAFSTNFGSANLSLLMP